MRITFNQVRDGLDGINTAADQFAQAQWQVSTGLRIRVPSDDAAAAQRAIDEQGTLAQIDSYKATSDTASSRLSAMDTALGNIIERISEALVGLQSALGSTATQAVRDAAAATFDGVRDAIAADINSTFGGVHLFSGAGSDQSAYTRVAGNWVYQGTNASVTVEISEGRNVAITADGQAIIQGSDPQDLLTLLDSLATAARGNDSATLLSGVASLNSAMARASHAQSQVGYDESSIADSADRLATLKVAATARLSNDKDANMAEAMTRMSRAQTIYQSALGAVAAASKVSLLDYLK